MEVSLAEERRARFAVVPTCWSCAGGRRSSVVVVCLGVSTNEFGMASFKNQLYAYLTEERVGRSLLAIVVEVLVTYLIDVAENRDMTEVNTNDLKTLLTEAWSAIESVEVPGGGAHLRELDYNWINRVPKTVQGPGDVPQVGLSEIMNEDVTDLLIRRTRGPSTRDLAWLA